ncbi:hypothetical protein MTO96_005890 [Rhipicephalus appendiculatus]
MCGGDPLFSQRLRSTPPTRLSGNGTWRRTGSPQYEQRDLGGGSAALAHRHLLAAPPPPIVVVVSPLVAAPPDGRGGEEGARRVCAPD